jgi:hypothetical protein
MKWNKHSVLLIAMVGMTLPSYAAKYFDVKCDVELYGGHRVIQYGELNSNKEIASYRQSLIGRKLYKEGKLFKVYKVNECINKKSTFKDKTAVEVEKNQPD